MSRRVPLAQWDLGRVNRKVEVCRLFAEALPTLTHAQPTNPVVCGFTFCRHSRTLAMYSSWHLYGWKGKSTVTPFRVILGMLACSQEGTEVGQNAAVRLRQNPLRTSQGLSHSRGMMPAVTLGHDTVLHRNPYGMDTRTTTVCARPHLQSTQAAPPANKVKRQACAIRHKALGQAKALA